MSDNKTDPVSSEAASFDYQFANKIIDHHLREQQSAKIWKNFFKLGWLMIMVAIVVYMYLDYFNSDPDTNGSISGKSSEHYALVRYQGAVDEENVNKFLDLFEDAISNNKSKAVIVKADSYGGSVVYSNILYDTIKELKAKHDKKVYVVIEGVCASGCYYGFSQADAIYANRVATVGSIGVISRRLNYSRLLSKIGVENATLTAGRLKAFGDPASPESEEVTAYRQHLLDYYHNIFVNDIMEARGSRLKLDEEPDMFSGKIWIGKEALDIGLVDGLMNVDQLVDSITPEGKKKLKVVRYAHPENPIERFLKYIPAISVDAVLDALSDRIQESY